MSYYCSIPQTLRMWLAPCLSHTGAAAFNCTWSVNNNPVVKGLQRLHTLSHGFTKHMQPKHLQEGWNINIIIY